MSSIPPKTEGRRRPVTVLALKLWEIAEELDQRLDDPAPVLEMLVNSAAKGEQASETWSRLHAAAARFDKATDLALSYEQVTHDKRIKLLPPEQQAYIFLNASRFFAEVLADSDGAAGYAERAIQAVPGEPEAFSLLESLLTASGKLGRLAEHYADASEREQDPDRRVTLLERAWSIALSLEDARELVIDVGQRLLKLRPADEVVREEVMRRLLVSGRHLEVVELLEQALRREPAPPPEEAKLYREQLVDLCFTVLKSPERALTHLEGLLALDPEHSMALEAARGLLGDTQLMLRAAAALSDAYEKVGNIPGAVELLGFELQHVRGPRRVDVQRRLGILRQDALDDPDGALELLGPVVAGDPGDDDLRARFVALHLRLNQPEQAARLLSRALTTHRDPAVRARVGVDVGNVYLRSGDPKRAEVAFQKVLETEGDERATLEAAKNLAALFADKGDPKQLREVLAIVVRLEPEKEQRQAAARRLARLADADELDRERATLAYRALVGSPYSDEALSRLEALYQEAGDDVGLSDVLAFRAERTKDPELARELGVRALELRTAGTRDPEEAIRAYQSFSQTFGATREVHARLMPLLESTGRFVELAQVLRAEIELLPRDEQSASLLRLAELCQGPLADPTGALAALERAVILDRHDAAACAALEKLLALPETRLGAAAILEPLYRDAEPGPGLLRVLEARAEGAADVEERLAAAERASALAQSLRDPERAFEIAARALGTALREAPERAGDWARETERLASACGNPARRAALICDALEGREVDSTELFALACIAGEAAGTAGDLPRAIDVYRRALRFDPHSATLMHAVDELLAHQGAPADRLALYESALAQATDSGRRRDLLHAMARLQERELDDALGAIATLRRAVGEDPLDLSAHDALLDALSSAGDFEAAMRELERILPALEGDRRSVALLRLAEAAERAGNHEIALARYRELLERADLADDVLASVERLALAQNDGATLFAVLQRRLAQSGDAKDRSHLLERLGNTASWQLGDAALAAELWLKGARLAETAPVDLERARRLYDRVLDADPKSTEAAERLVELCARGDDWTRLAEVVPVLLESADERRLVPALLDLVAPALEAGRAAELVTLYDRALQRQFETLRARQLELAKARLLATMPKSADRAARTFRELLATAKDDATAEVTAFSDFLQKAVRTPARAADLRFLYAFRAERVADPSPVWLAWARAEEHELGDRAAAIELYRQVLDLDESASEAYTELARLLAETGDAKGALGALTALKQRSEPDQQNAVDLRIAALLVEQLGDAAAALELAGPILAAHPSDRDALRVVHRALAFPETRSEAAHLLERTADASDDPARRADVIEALLAVSAEAPDLAEARSRWLTQLLASKEHEPAEALSIALAGAESALHQIPLWEIAEQMARRLDNPTPVVEAYTRAFERPLPPELANELGRRRVEFHEEWFDEPERVVELLEHVIALCPTASWAFDRLKLAFNHAGRWQDLFALYDARLAAGIERSESIELLREASMAARDFAGDAERAMGYLEALNRLSPGDARVEASLERLYERHGRKRPLIELFTARLAQLSEAERPELVGRIAALWLDLGEPEPALELAESLVAMQDYVADGVQLLERLITLPNSTVPSNAGDPATRPLVRATARLKTHYAAQGSVLDVVRMLEIEERAAPTRLERRALLEQILRLRLSDLDDAIGAFETAAELVLLDPDVPAYRKQLGELGWRVGAHERRAAVLVSAADSDLGPELRAGLLNEAASVHQNAIGDDARATELYRRVLELGAAPRGAELTAARELSTLLRAAGDPAERVHVLERQAALEDDPEARRSALGEAAALAFDVLGDGARAIAAYRLRIADDPTDLPALDGLCRALEATERWDELIAALEARAAIQPEPSARADRVRVARLHAEVKADRSSAIDAWRRAIALHGRDREAFEALSALLAAEGRWAELGELISSEIANEPSEERRSLLWLALGSLHEQRTGDSPSAVEAFVAGGDWQSAMRVAGSSVEPAEHGRAVCFRLLELSIEAWRALRSGPESAPARAADWSIDELGRRLLASGEYANLVDLLLQGAALPLALRRRRELRREAACLASDHLADAQRAIRLFQELIEQDPADDVAAASVGRLSALLEESGRFDEMTALWENQAVARGRAGDASSARELWARAGALAEERLGASERALAAYERGAELGGEECLEALARVHSAAGRLVEAAEALERLTASSSAEALSERALRLAETYVALGKRGRARETLESALPRVADGAAMRARLGLIYREARDYTALASLIEEEASRASDPSAELALLREAADLHLEQRHDPAPAIPLLERAIRLAAEDFRLRLRLSRALHDAGRYADAADVLREQLARYGARRPKDRALVHYELARVLLAAEDRAQALAELDAAARIDPADSKILHMLARTALEQGELDRAERMYRALLLVPWKDGDADAPSKSEALLALADIAASRGDSGRAEEFVSSAFETALESAHEAERLAQSLRLRGRPELFARALELRLAHGLPPNEAARAIAELAELHTNSLGDLSRVKVDLFDRVFAIETELEREESSDDTAWAAIGRAYAALGDLGAESRILERRLDASARSSQPAPDPELYYRLARVRLSKADELDQGLDLLERALELGEDLARAEELIRASFPEGHEPPRVLDLLEQSARARGDTRALLAVLERRIALGDCSIESLREGVSMAATLEADDIAERLLASALESGRFERHPGDAAWLRVELARHRLRAGDTTAALDLEEQAAHYLGRDEARGFLLELAQKSLSHGDLERAERVLEALRADEPANREVFEPLLGLYRQSGRATELVELLDATAPIVDSPSERARLRLEQAETLLNVLGRREEAIFWLKQILRDDPSRRDVRARLFELLDSEGRDDELVELLGAEIHAAYEAGERETAAALTTRLLALLERRGLTEQALEVCRRGLEADPGARDLLEARLRLTRGSTDHEARAHALESLLELERGERAGELCRELVALRDELGDAAGAERALELGFAARPADAELRTWLADRYEARGEHARVADLFERAFEANPDDPELLERLVQTHRAAGRTEQALEAVEALLQRRPADAALGRTRAALLVELGRHEQALSELERAFAADATVLPDLVEALEAAIQRADRATAGPLIRRLVEALEQAGDRAGARTRLAELARTDPDDVGVLRRLAELELEAGAVEDAIVAYARLVKLEEGSELVAAAIGHADACERAGRSAEARASLARALRVEPHDAELGGRLRRVLEAEGDHRELAGLLRDEATREAPSVDRTQKLLRAGELFLLADTPDDLEEATRVLELARADAAENVEVVVLLARAYARAGRLEEALSHLDAAIEAQRGRRSRPLSALYEQKADVHLEEGFLTDALNALLKAFEMDPKNARLGMRLGRLAYESEEDDMAQRALRSVAIMKTASLDGPDGARPETKADANYSLAMIARRAGDLRKARVLVSKALSENPDHAEAKVLLQKLEAR